MIEIIVPATTANIGPGFDCLGMALNLYNKVLFEEIEDGLQIHGCEERFNNKENLVYTSMIHTFKKVGYTPSTGFKITMDCHIPESRGLGSSAACILAGVIGATELSNSKLNKEEILKIATEIEGHPDNITPALFGGMTVSIQDQTSIHFSKVPIQNNFRIYGLIPDFTLSTKESRAVLPQEVSFQDAVFNVGRTALMLASFMNGDLELLNFSIDDKLHQNYRASLIPEYPSIIEKLNFLDIKGSFLSGAGPAIIVIAGKDNLGLADRIQNRMLELENKWTVKEFNMDTQGALIKRWR